MEWLIERLMSLIPAISHLSKEKRDIADNALTAISTALSETSLYLAHIQNDGSRDRSREEKLALLWAAAAVPARHIDGGLADMCQHKSESWINPNKWNRDKIDEYGIGIDTVKKRFAELLRAA
ncbi:MAG: hypothetical protein ACYSU4_02320 [Planctomycetota bacterium]|jgi:hypothetical protein